MSDRPRDGATITTGAAAAVVALVLGACLGWWAVRFVPPTTADVREAARSLVPPGLAVRSTGAGYLGDFPARGPYSAGITLDGGGTVDERQAAYRDLTQAQEWGPVGTEKLPNAVVLQYDRDGLTARVSVRLTGTSSVVGVGRIREPDLRLKLPLAATGAALGLGTWFLVLRRGRSRGAR